MNIHLSAGPLVSLLAGILISIVPRLLNYIVGPAIGMRPAEGLAGPGLSSP
jgi:hypothetical protein